MLSDGLAEVLDLLACPHCQQSVTSFDRKTVSCRNGHNFDVARQGYLNLSSQSTPQHADSAAMVQARQDFFAKGHFDQVASEVVKRVGQSRTIVDAGAGPGWYLAQLMSNDHTRRGLAVDISPAAIKKAAKVHPRIGAVVADTWSRLPIRSQRIDMVCAIFAPKNIAEFWRVLVPGGLLLTITPDPEHLIEVRSKNNLLDIPADKQATIHRQTAGLFEPVGSTRVRYGVELTAADVTNLVQMGPNAFHEPQVRAESLQTTISVNCDWFRKPIS